jgi:mannose-6-phosphate isomerase-like protein (cupin superfamily)
MKGMTTAGACLLTAVVAIGLGYHVGLSAPRAEKGGYVIETEAQVAREEPGTHNGGGMSTGYRFFTKVPNLPMVLTKRALHAGAGIGYHLQKEDEIYYFLSGTGVMTIDDKPFPVSAGMAVLTRTGSSHGLKQTGKDDLVLIINYPHETRAPRPAAPAAGR